MVGWAAGGIALAGGAAAALGPDRDGAAPAGPGFVLLCGRPGSVLEPLAAAVVGGAVPTPGLAWPAHVLEARLHERTDRGVPLQRAVFDALEAAGRALLMPAELEPTLLPPGVDPVRVF